MKLAHVLLATLTGLTESAIACTAPKHNEQIRIDVRYELTDDDQFAVLIQHPKTFDGLALNQVDMTIYEGSKVLVYTLVAPVDGDRERSTVVVAGALLEQTEIRVWYGPSDAGLCPAYRSIRLRRPD